MGKMERSQIFRHFGIEAQIAKLHEEVDEVYEAYLSGDVEHLSEELGDVRLVLKQIEEDKEIRDFDVTRHWPAKEQRTLERIKEGYYEDRKTIG
ncbi:MAG: hypothetical protein GT601_05920 [Acidaminobacter sp.]|uniref:MazG nucleotide pyrophosphohydrolase domain-containing protein n=1 Tax=Acidaminobacter sp. TaxID=1872102 RepID=UPI00137D7CCA|nr:MazG nucleotide pyrophosphohydrolase domain-containing protein [Acidaminobacter sp.]MZQ97193.1 hypothetical protein [Acidaminobacter sp.]